MRGPHWLPTPPPEDDPQRRPLVNEEASFTELPPFARAELNRLSARMLVELIEQEEEHLVADEVAREMGAMALLDALRLRMIDQEDEAREGSATEDSPEYDVSDDASGDDENRSVA